MKLVGYDLNGWRDFAARNWSANQEEDAAAGEPLLTSGGVGGVVVSTSVGRGVHTQIGGLQAIRSPHGRGPGWGRVGAVERRHRVAEMLEKPWDNEPAIEAAMLGMADPRRCTVAMAIPDFSTYEKEQESFLRILSKLRCERRLLVWRSVLSCLNALSKQWVDTDALVGIVTHEQRGLTSQKLLMKAERGIVAPERRSTGLLHSWSGDLLKLFNSACAQLHDAVKEPSRTTGISRIPGAVPLALGEPFGPELLRHDNGDWEVVQLPPTGQLLLSATPPGLADHLSDCDVVLVDTPTAGEVREALVALVSEAVSSPVVVLQHGDVALGALTAAQGLAEGTPIYFDFLPQISTIVHDGRSAISYDLIPPGTVLPAGQIYRSRDPATFGLSAGMESVKVYLRKESADECRLALVDLPAVAVQDQTVDLHLEQAPASGRARLTLASEHYSVPLTVDWDDAVAQDDGWDDIVASLQPSRPTIPNRLVLPCSLLVWHGVEDRRGLSEALEDAVTSGQPDWKELADFMASRPEQTYAVSSDGELPDGLAQSDLDHLENVTELARRHVRTRLTSKLTDSNDSLRFLSWQFQRGAIEIVEPLLDALKAKVGDHPFVQHPASRQLIYQALGRVTVDRDHQRAILEYLLSIPLESWKRDPTACAAFLLSRTDTAPTMLDRTDIKKLALVICRKNQEAIGGKYTSSFMYTPYLMMGLIRCRLQNSTTLVTGNDALADSMLESTERVISDMKKRFSHMPKINRQRKVLEECCDELRGQGTSPDILRELANMANG